MNTFYKFADRSPSTIILLDNPILKGTITNELLYGNMNVVLLPLDLYYYSGRKWADILFRNRAAYFVSEKFINILIDNNLTGWETYSLRIWDKDNKNVKGYFGLSITGRCNNNLNTISSEKTIKGWDGSDFFIMEETSAVFMTIRAFECLNGNITNSNFKTLNDYINL